MPTAITPNKETVFVEDVSYKRSWSEALGRKFGAAINYINSRFVYSERVDFGGYFRVTTISGLTQSIYFNNEVEINAYAFDVYVTANGNHRINFKVIDTDGTILGDLFTTSVNINGAGRTHAVVGYDFLAASNIERNITGLTVNYGTINPAYLNLSTNLFTIPKGYSLRAFIESSSGNAVGCSFSFFLGIKS